MAVWHFAPWWGKMNWTLLQTNMGTTLGPLNWEKTFKNIQKNTFDRKANGLRWKILHRCSPAAKRLAGRSPFFLSTCQVCDKHEENLTHLFFLCPSAKKIRKYITTLIRQRFSTYVNYSVTFKDILCDFQDLDELRNSSVARFLRGIGLRHIWQHRNAVVYNDQQPDTLCIFKAKINQKVKTELHMAKLLENMKTINETGRTITYWRKYGKEFWYWIFRLQDLWGKGTQTDPHDLTLNKDDIPFSDLPHTRDGNPACNGPI